MRLWLSCSGLSLCLSLSYCGFGAVEVEVELGSCWGCAGVRCSGVDESERDRLRWIQDVRSRKRFLDGEVKWLGEATNWFRHLWGVLVGRLKSFVC